MHYQALRVVNYFLLVPQMFHIYISTTIPSVIIHAFVFISQIKNIYNKYFNFQNKKDNLFDKQLITSFALNDLTHTKILNDMYSKDILIFADLLNNTTVQNWNIEIKNALITVNSDYWKTIF